MSTKYQNFVVLAQGTVDFTLEAFATTPNIAEVPLMTIGCDFGAVYVSIDQAKTFFGLTENTNAVTKDDYKKLQLEWEGIDFNPDDLDLTDRMREISKLMADSPWTFDNDSGEVVAVEENNAAVAAIQYALEDPDAIDFLRLWNEGEFQVLRDEWDDVPEEVFIGADPLHKNSN